MAPKSFQGPDRQMSGSAPRPFTSHKEPQRARQNWNSMHFGTLVHFGAVVADAPSPLSTPRSAAGQAQLRLGKPLRMKCRASPVLLFMRAGRVVSGTVGIVRATVPFHGEHDALEPTKVKRGQGGGRASALAPELSQNPPARLFPGTAGPSEPTLAAVLDGALLPSS